MNRSPGLEEGPLIRRQAEIANVVRGIVATLRRFQLARFLLSFERDGGRGRNRTFNLSVKSRMLCQLSYASMV